MAVDLLAVCVGLLLGYWARFHSPLVHFLPPAGGHVPEHYLAMLPKALIVWFLALRLENLYRRRARLFDFGIVRKLVTGSALAMLVMIAFAFFSPDRSLAGEFSRAVVTISLAAVCLTLIASRLVLHTLYRWMMLRRGFGQSRVVIVGGGEIAAHLCAAMLRHPENGLIPVGLIEGDHLADSPAAHPAPGNVPKLGSVRQLEALLLRHQIDEVIMVQADLDDEGIPHLLTQCERAHADFRIVPKTTDRLLSGMTVETLDGIPLLGIRETPLQGWNAALKRGLDMTVAAVGLLLCGWFLLILAWLIRRQDGHPGFFRQERMGIDGRLFHIIKPRTMRPGAEDQSGPIFASDRDPRCTPLGEFLRRTHLDEIPQLINVLRGEMSFVGPRPERPYFIERFRESVPRYMARHKVKSGITGWAQVNGLCGKHGSINERLKYDLYYIENWSLWLDIKILALTVFGRVRPGAAVA